MDKIIIENYEVVALHGVNPEEKINPQRFLISCELETDFSLASKSVEISLSNAVAQNDFDVLVSLFIELNVKLYKSNILVYFG